MATEQNGLLSFINSPMGQGLLAAGLGAAATRGTPLQAIGRGGLLGMGVYGNAAAEQENRLIKAAQERQRAEALERLTPDAQGRINADPATLAAAGIPAANWKDLPNLNREQVKDYANVRNPDGSVSRMAFGEYGNVTNTGATPFEAPKVVDMGGTQAAYDPITGQTTNIGGKTLTPDQRVDAVNQPFMLGPDGKPVANSAYQDFALRKSAAGAPSIRVENKTGDSLAAQIGPMLKESSEAASGARKQLSAADQIDNALATNKIFTGPMANVKMTAAQWATDLGVGGKDDAEKVANTREAIQGLANLTLQGRQQMRGQGAITESESKLAERALSGDVTLTPVELGVLTNAARRSANYQMGEHQRKVELVRQNPNYGALADFYDMGTPPQQAEQARPAPSAGGLPRPTSPAEAMRLPPGTRFIDPNGVERTR